MRPRTSSRQLLPFGVRVTVEKSTMASKLPDTATGPAGRADRRDEGAGRDEGEVGRSRPSARRVAVRKTSTVTPAAMARRLSMGFLRVTSPQGANGRRPASWGQIGAAREDQD